MLDALARRSRAHSARWRTRLLTVAGVCLSLLLAVSTAQATMRMVVEDHAVTGWDMDDGLPHNLVHAIAQDASGLIWAATWEGAARFNGRTFTVFNRENTPGAELSGVFSFIPEPDGGMLAGTADGVYRFGDGKWLALGRGALSGVRVDAMLLAKDGGIWVAELNRLYRIDPNGNVEELAASFGLPKSRITALAQQADGDLLVATEQGLYRVHARRAAPWGHELGMGSVTVRRMVSDRNGGWYVAADNGVWQIHAAGFSHHLRPSRRADAIMLDRSGALWINLSAGDVVRRDPRGNELSLRLPGVLTAGLMEDAEGLIWAGSSAGLFQISRGAAHGVSGSEGYIRSVLQTDDGAIWIGHAAGLKRLRAGVMNDISQNNSDGLEDSVPSLGLSYQPNHVWVGTYSRGVYRFDSNGKVVQQIELTPGKASPMVRAVQEVADGTLWIGTASNGLYRYRNGELTNISVGDGLPSEAVQVVYDDPAGGIWVGTTAGMAHVSATGKVRGWEARKQIPAQSVFDFLRDGHGEFWVATDRGLLRMRGESFDVFDHARGLPKDKVFRILEDGRDYFWLLSNRGVFRVDRSEIDQIDAGTRTQLSVVVVDDTDGMPDNQGNGGTWPAGWRTVAGNLLFPTAAGLGLIEPRRVDQTRPGPIPVVLEYVSIDGVRQPPRGGVNISSGAHRVVVGYAGLDFRASERVRYRYRMRGFDRDWIQADGSTEAVYTNLPPGHYTFELQAMRLPLDWLETQRIGSTTLTVKVRPPFWQHWGFVTSAVLAAVAMLVSFWWWRSANYRRRQKVLNRIIDTRTRELTEKNMQLEENARERDELLKKLAHQASHDALTGLPNRRAADRHLEDAVAASLTDERPLTVALLDLDHFKAINDGYGHDAGDQVLRRIGMRLRGISGMEVFSSRHGGEEFLLVLVGISPTEARHMLETLRKDIAAETLTLDNGRLLRYTVSIGMASLGPYLNTVRHLLGTADRHLYQAKGQGRNRVIG